MPKETAVQTAQRLAREHRDRIAFSPLSAEHIGDLGYAYAVQDELVSTWLEETGGQIAGWKIGLTTRRMQQLCGVNQPISGAVISSKIFNSIANIALDKWIRLGIEMELAVRLSPPLPSTKLISIQHVRSCLGEVCAAFELVEDRAADYSALDAASIVADNSWNGGIVLGPPRSPAPGEALVGRQGLLALDGVVIDKGMTEDAGGDPLEVVAWVANLLRSRGRELEPGQWVMTGSVIPTQFAKRGQTFQFQIEGLEPVGLRIA
jgi:2-keto-4-pentenoate hydratase